MALGIGDCYNASYGNPVDYPVYLEEEGLLDLCADRGAGRQNWETMASIS